MYRTFMASNKRHNHNRKIRYGKQQEQQGTEPVAPLLLVAARNKFQFSFSHCFQRLLLQLAAIHKPVQRERKEERERGREGDKGKEREKREKDERNKERDSTDTFNHHHHHHQQQSRKKDPPKMLVLMLLTVT